MCVYYTAKPSSWITLFIGENRWGVSYLLLTYNTRHNITRSWMCMIYIGVVPLWETGHASEREVRATRNMWLERAQSRDWTVSRDIPGSGRGAGAQGQGSRPSSRSHSRVRVVRHYAAAAPRRTAPRRAASKSVVTFKGSKQAYTSGMQLLFVLSKYWFDEVLSFRKNKYLYICK